MHHEVRRLELRELLIRELVYAPGMRMTRHAHDYSNVTVVVGGEIEEHASEGRYRGRAGSVLLKPAGCEHENASTLGAHTLSIELREGVLANELASRQWIWFEQAAVVRAALAFCRASQSDIEARAMELLAAATAAPRASKPVPQWLPRIVSALEERFDEPVRLESLARDLGLHPVYVSRAFRQHVGMTMHDYLRSLRLRHARHLLSASRRSITAIASEAGFSDPSHLSHTFGELLGVTPRSFRNLSRQVQSVQVRLRDAS